MNQDPCKKESDELRNAIHEWIQASEATRHFIIDHKWSVDEDQDTYSPDYFRAMQKSFDKERAARERYILANRELYDCKEEHDLIR